MIDDVLKDVRQAEQKAEELLKRAYQRGKDLVLKAEAEADAQKKSTVSECKQDRAKILQNAHAQADEKTAAILQRSAENSEYYIQDKQPAVDACADRIVEILLGKYIKADCDETAEEGEGADNAYCQPDEAGSQTDEADSTVQADEVGNQSNEVGSTVQADTAGNQTDEVDSIV